MGFVIAARLLLASLVSPCLSLQRMADHICRAFQWLQICLRTAAQGGRE